jgi:hypothetical protein
VDVSEGGGEEVSAALAGSEALDNGDSICGRAVEALVGDTACVESVLLATDDADLDLEDHVRFSARLQEIITTMGSTCAMPSSRFVPSLRMPA